MTSPDQPLPPMPPPSAPAEPLIGVGAVTAVVTAVLALLVALGLPISDELQAAILTVVAVVAPIVVAIAGRKLVWSPATVRKVIEAATKPNQPGGF